MGDITLDQTIGQSRLISVPGTVSAVHVVAPYLPRGLTSVDPSTLILTLDWSMHNMQHFPRKTRIYTLFSVMRYVMESELEPYQSLRHHGLVCKITCNLVRVLRPLPNGTKLLMMEHRTQVSGYPVLLDPPNRPQIEATRPLEK